MDKNRQLQFIISSNSINQKHSYVIWILFREWICCKNIHIGQDKIQENFKKMQHIFLHISNCMEHLQRICKYCDSSSIYFILISSTEYILCYSQVHGNRKMIMTMLMMNCFCYMVNRRKVLNLITSGDLCQRSSQTQISDILWARFQPALNLVSVISE